MEGISHELYDTKTYPICAGPIRRARLGSWVHNHFRTQLLELPVWLTDSIDWKGAAELLHSELSKHVDEGVTNAARQVVEYLSETKSKEYDRLPEEQRKGHIFEHIKTLVNWLAYFYEEFGDYEDV